MKLSLVVLNSGKAAGQSIAITTPQFIIGRDPKCNLRPASAAVSMRHCAIFIRQGKVYVRDFESTNGTMVNDEPVKGDRLLEHGDQLKVGPLHFQVAIERTTPVDKPTPLPKGKKATAGPAKADAPANAEPAPAAATTPAADGSDDDDAGAMLLALDEEAPGGPTVEPTSDEESVPGGSTIMEIPAVVRKDLEEAAGEAPAAEAEKKPEPPKKPPSSNNNAQSAASALLERLRKGGVRKSE